MSDTPRTDAIAHRGYPPDPYIAEMTRHAREIERELAAERALADRLADWLDKLLCGYDDAQEIAPFDHAEAHGADKAVEAWKEARRE